MFFGVPFGLGLLTTVLLLRRGPRSFSYCAGLSFVAMIVAGLIVLSFAIEGLICMVMALPIALLLTIAGVFVGRAIDLPCPRNLESHSMLIALLIVTICPLIAATERFSAIPVDTFSVVTSVEINADPMTVWKHVVAFPELPTPQEPLFLSGIAHPIRARIEGSGPGAIRYCEFSTGPFVEPITIWHPGELLAFDVTSNPSPMRELSPYNIHPPHLDNYMRSKRGQFRLISINGGHSTRLEGTTWYQQSLYPSAYWRLWTDWIIHKIHFRVLDHIRTLSEA